MIFLRGSIFDSTDVDNACIQLLENYSKNKFKFASTVRGTIPLSDSNFHSILKHV